MQRIVLAMLCVLMGTGAVPDPQAGSPSTAREAIGLGALVKELIDQHDSLTALSLVYEQEPTTERGRPAGAYTRRLVAACRPGFFFRDNGHGHDRMRISEDPYRKILLVTPTEATLLETLNRVLYEADMKHSGPAPDNIGIDLIFRALCWWPFANWSPPEFYGRPWSMSSLLKGGAYSLRPQQEAVESRPCYVLEVKDTDVIWVDCERPRCVLRRDIYNPATRSVQSRFEMTDYREAGDGIWLPGRLRNLQFDSNAHTPSLRARVVIDAKFLIHDIKVNGAVEPGTFRLDLEPGTVHRVVSHGEERFEPVRDGQAEHFQSILAWSRTNARWPEVSAARPAARAWVFAAVGMAAGGLAVALARRPSTRQARPAGAAGRSGVD
jgi:hypothetical protein